MKSKHLRILFIGNSHTYMNDLPAWVKTMAREDGFSCDVTMLAHDGWYLSDHIKEPQTKFNVMYGDYDYIVLQEHSHPFDRIDAWPDIELYNEDGAHASRAGTEFAAKIIWTAIEDNISEKTTR